MISVTRTSEIVLDSDIISIVVQSQIAVSEEQISWGNKVYIVEDTKGAKTDVYKLKAKMFLFKYGFEITEM
jgi:hypothetical protein